MITGEVKVNDLVLLSWEAENTGARVSLWNEPDTYLYEVRAVGLDYRHKPFSLDFQLSHIKRDGVAVLTTMILNELNLRVGIRSISGQDSN